MKNNMGNSNRVMSNFAYFKDTLGDNWKEAYKNFKNADVEEDMIVCSYDAEGFCTFERTEKSNVWEFTGTAK